MVRIPQEYQEVEYLESTGTQYIITNYYPQTDWTAVDWTFAFTANQNGDQMLWGARSAKNGRKIWQCEKYSDRSWYVACGSVGYRSVLADYGRKLNRIYTGHVDNTTFTVDGGSASPTHTYTGENESAIGIFCWNKNGLVDFKNSGLRIYSLTFKENDMVSANFIPCYRKSDNEPGMYDTVSGTFYTNNGTGTFLVGNPVDYSTISLLEARRRILLNTPHLESLSGAMASFETDIASNLKECKIHFTPIQEGSGDPSPENVRPIVGWDGVTVTRCGKNLFDASGEYLNNKWINNNGEIVDSLSNRPTLIYTKKIPVVSGTDYTIHGACNNIQYIRIVYYDENDNFLGRVVSDGKPNPSKKFTPITGTAYVLVNPDTAIQNIQLEKGSSATTYEPYTAQTLTIPFPQTIYGGYVDLVKGEVAEEFEYIDMKNLNWFQAWNGFIVNRTTAEKFEPYAWPNIACEIYKTVDTVPLHNLARIDDKSITGRAYFKYIGIRDDSISSVEDFMSAVSGHHIAYKLATPITYPLDPVTIRTLKGINNIWSNANGNIEVKFWTH